MTVGVVDGPSRVADSQVLASGLTVSPIVGTTVGVEMGGLMDKSSGHRVSTLVRSVPVGTAQVDLSILVGI